MLSWFSNLFHLLFPETCAACNRQLQHHEDLLCLYCQHDLPYTNFHTHPTDNPIAKHFWGRVPLQNTAAYLHFSKGGRVQHLIHLLKYKNRPDVGEVIGKQYGEQLAKLPDWQTIDWVIPVPLHPAKELKRGYNQSDTLAKGLADGLGTAWSRDILVRRTYTESQTRKGRFARWINVETVFDLIDPEKIRGKHLLLVDDVITTGATIEACAQKLLAIEGVKVSVVSIACVVK